MWKLVDDTMVSEVIPASKHSSLQQAADYIHNCSRENHLQLNPTKCKEIHTCFKRTPPCFSQVSIEGVDFEWEGMYAKILLTDFSKEFDLVDHRALLHELEVLGVHEAIVHWVGAFLVGPLQRVRINGQLSSAISPCGGITQDGASVKTGENKGMKGWLKEQNAHMVHIHCMAHRLALCTSQAANDIPCLKKYQEWLTSLFYCMKASATREKELHKVQEVLDHPALKNASKDPKAKGLLKAMASTQFIYITYLLMDVLPIVSHLCLQLQAENLDVAKAKDIVEVNGHHEFKGHVVPGEATSAGFADLKNEFLDELIGNIYKRFPKKSLMDSFFVMVMRTINLEKDQEEFGNTESEELLKHFGEEKVYKGKHHPPVVSKAEVRREWAQAKSIVRENDNLSPVCRASLLEIFDDPVTARDLDIELAAMIDAGKHFVQATYYLEGDGPLVFACYERLSALAHAIAIDSYPNTEAKARQHAGRNMALYNQLVAQGKACINPGFRFYQQKFSVQFHNVVRAFKAARLCCPVQVQALRPTAVSVQDLKQFSFITDAEVVQLVEELPNYLATADGAAIETEEDKVHWWATHAAALPNWSAAVKKILLVQPSSASAERVFSLLQNAFKGEFTEEDVKKWSSEEVSSWPRKDGFHEEADIFHAEKITGKTLFSVEKSDLKELGINTLGRRLEATRKPAKHARASTTSGNSSDSSGSTLSSSSEGFLVDYEELEPSSSVEDMSAGSAETIILIFFETLSIHLLIVKKHFLPFGKALNAKCRSMGKYQLLLPLAKTLVMAGHVKIEVEDGSEVNYREVSRKQVKKGADRALLDKVFPTVKFEFAINGQSSSNIGICSNPRWKYIV
ncbi:hypothetical protein AWC38_SpisGene10087 [Stylophora pistillata]|uniref:SAM domain-containing protein n=1 Tax=Stylophora pistillata TaxID=50429 RepID=A0A2B4S8F3_STYPI|nr:hypothetical protein AWC38_SpisGene10087 [Stylophora pistillata]